jgi:hypothetical protein
MEDQMIVTLYRDGTGWNARDEYSNNFNIGKEKTIDALFTFVHLNKMENVEYRIENESYSRNQAETLNVLTVLKSLGE